jgi:hypothetical protein
MNTTRSAGATGCKKMLLLICAESCMLPADNPLELVAWGAGPVAQPPRASAPSPAAKTAPIRNLWT